MTNEEIEQVKSLALAFRAAIEQCRPRLGYVALKHFPHGSCSDTSDLLGRFLQANGFPGWTVVSGHRNKWTHAWLERDGVCVDITADQFEDSPGAVVVALGPAWHRQFTVDSRRPVGQTCPMPEFALQIEQSYRLIVNELERDE